ncbi:MAG: PAS domain S-box protein [Acetobacteraceae bacterium]|nr:PAS domain S-box protein [Acetobacteraceae bacterium]
MLRLLLRALERARLGLLVLRSSDGGVVYANTVFADFTGLERSALVDHTIFALIPAEASALAREAFLSAVAAGQDWHGTLPLARRGGGLVFAALTVVPLAMDSAGAQVLVIARDVSEEERRAREEARLQRVLAEVFRRLDVAAAVVGPDDRILVANRAYAALTGHSLAELAGLPVDRLTAPEDRAEAAIRRAAQRATGEAYAMPLTLLRRDGTRLPVLLRSVAIEDEGTRLRLVTLREDHAVHSPVLPPEVAAGEVRFLRLDALRRALGPAWPEHAPRLLLHAETVLRRRLHPHDVFARTAEGDFAIWFESGDPLSNQERLSRLAREVRVELAGELDAALAGAGAAETVPLTSPVP